MITIKKGLVIPNEYKSKLDLMHTQIAIKEIKDYFENELSENYMYQFHPALKPILPDDIYFITTQELEGLYPHYTPKQREEIITKEHGAVFIMQIGGPLRYGERHDVRSPDYDDWKLNGDLLFWNPLLEQSVEISSMGIRVDEQALINQLNLAKNEDRRWLEYHQCILGGNLPYSIGGGIGQSRLCMFFLKKAHIGEVQASIWNEQIIKDCEESNIMLL